MIQSYVYQALKHVPPTERDSLLQVLLPLFPSLPVSGGPVAPCRLKSGFSLITATCTWPTLAPCNSGEQASLAPETFLWIGKY